MKVDPHLAGMEQEVTKQEDWEGKKLEAGKPPNRELHRAGVLVAAQGCSSSGLQLIDEAASL